MNVNDDRLWLLDMLQYAQEVHSSVQNRTREDLDQDLLFVRGLSMSIGIVGEAASKLSADFRDANPSIPWRNIILMRNLLFHRYFKIDHHILWQTATNSIPPLIVELKKLLNLDQEDA
jgi:uncharacterized protein with HEPN domain